MSRPSPQTRLSEIGKSARALSTAVLMTVLSKVRESRRGIPPRLTLQCSHFVPTKRVDAGVAAGESLEHGPQTGAAQSAARPVPKLLLHAGIGGRSARRPGSLMSVFS
jgi:hypothetical protein